MAPPLTPVTGREIIIGYIQGIQSTEAGYKRLCLALTMLKSLSEDERLKFLDQICDVGALLDEKCSEFVQKLGDLTWNYVPSSMIAKFQRLLFECALRHLRNMEIITASCVRHFKPISDIEQTPEELDAQFKLAHSIINQLLRCSPTCANHIFNLVRKFPHHSSPVPVFVWHLRNAILVGEYAPHMRPKLWSSIIRELLILDSLVSKANDKMGDFNDDKAGIFILEEENVTQEDQKDLPHVVQIIDAGMNAVFQYIAVHAGLNLEIEPWLRVGETMDMLKLLQEPFEMQLLMASDTHIVSFVWLYLCSLNESHAAHFFEFLWNIITKRQTMPSDAKKSQCAAAYLAAFLARAKFVNSKIAFDWLDRIASWLMTYVDNLTGSSSILMPGASRHGTFYALCQAYFLIFCFRYKKIADNSEKLERLRTSSLARIVNSPLEPLKWVSHPVALCFATITRARQLIYCYHQVAPTSWSQVQLPFEPSFPLDTYNLPETSSFVSPLMRKFAPLAEDINSVRREFSKVLDTEIKDSDSGINVGSSLAFLDEEEGEAMEIGSYSATSIPIIAGGSMRIGVEQAFNSFYAASPGLKSFEYGSPPQFSALNYRDLR